MLAQRVVAHVALQTTDGDRLALLADDAHRLTLRFLWADAAADRRQVVLHLHRLDRGGHVALAQRLDKLRNLDADRAARDAGRLGALQTTLGLGQGVFPCVAQGHFLEVSSAHLRLLCRHFVPLDLHTFSVGKRRHTCLLQSNFVTLSRLTP